ncbi:MAG TPA: hypothetical protein VM513_16045 [Kofleriaceae bacterium]|nr:hypothetical protein [Kofleriaceae bacterium]
MRSLVLVIVALAASVRYADAYPYFQRTSSSFRCNQCHIAPAGGGLLTPYGIEESADTIGRGGDGRFLHGLIELPETLAISGDLRAAALANDVGATEGVELAAFPMQADLAIAVKSGAWTVVVNAGARGRVRGGSSDHAGAPGSEVPDTSLASYVISREHYVMWRPDEAAGIYVRAGRFSAPYGLRHADHTMYARRYLGYNLQQETYGVGVGHFGDTVEIHATGFVYDPLQGAVRKEAGGALLVEAQPGERWVIGASARASFAETSRLQAGIHAKLYLEGANLLFQGEAHGVRELFDGPGDRWQLAANAGPVWVPARGLYTGLVYEAFAEDLRFRGVTRHAAGAWVSVFPRAHVELMASGRGQLVGPDERAYLGMLQLHYWL